jgi:hypothetical protein
MLCRSDGVEKKDMLGCRYKGTDGSATSFLLEVKKGIGTSSWGSSVDSLTKGHFNSISGVRFTFVSMWKVNHRPLFYEREGFLGCLEKMQSIESIRMSRLEGLLSRFQPHIPHYSAFANCSISINTCKNEDASIKWFIDSLIELS